MNRVIALIDCDSFYCSCERLFRPDLLNQPVGVLSNNDGCFVSRTRELKELGVPMGAPYFKYKDVCEKNHVAVFSANFSLYTNLSDRVMSILAGYSPHLEIYSVDEAFLDLTGFDFYDLDSYIKKIRDDIFRQTGIPVSIGVGTTKTLAKVAARVAKKKLLGTFSVLFPKDLEWALKWIEVGDIWGIGSAKSLTLRTIGIKTAWDFKEYKNEKLIQKLLTKTGRMTQDELRGINCFNLELEVKKKKEIISSRTFGQPVYDLKSLRESVANYASLATEKMRGQGSSCHIVEVYIRTNPHKEIPQYSNGASEKMLVQTADTRKIIKYAWEALDKLFRHGYEYKKAMVCLRDIHDCEQEQLSLFVKGDSVKERNLMRVIDLINKREGYMAVKSAACGVDNRSWVMKQVFRSPRYVTGWSELPKVS